MPDDAEAQEHLDGGASGGDQQAESPGTDQTGAAMAGAEGSAGPEATLARLEGELAALKEQFLRKSADFDNYRKRALRDREEHAAFANRELLNDLLPVIDDFERAIRSTGESHDFATFHDGVVMIEKQLITMLERKWRLLRFDSTGESFDPQRHEAVIAEERADADTAVVLEDFQKGYLLNDRVLRPAKVRVAAPAQTWTAGSGDSRPENGEDR